MGMNALSGFGVAAAVGFMKGEGIKAPDIGAAVSAFDAASVAKEFKDLASNSDIGGALKEMADDFPQLFGTVPPDFQASLSPTGPVNLAAVAHANTSTLFTKGVGGFSQALGIAKGYGSQASDLLQSAASCTFAGDPMKMLTGGLSKLGGTDPEALSKVGKSLAGLGGSINLANPVAGMSPVNALKSLTDKGAGFVNNLHATVLNQTVKDPVSGVDLKIDAKLFDSISAEAKSLGKSVADNPLSKTLGNLMDSAVKGKDDLKAMAGAAGADSALAAVSDPTDFAVAQMGRAGAAVAGILSTGDIKLPAMPSSLPTPGEAVSAIKSVATDAVDKLGNILPKLPEVPSVGAISKFTDTLDLGKQLGNAASSLGKNLGISGDLNPKALADGLGEHIGGLDKIAGQGGLKALGDVMGKIQMPKLDLLGASPISQADFHGLIAAVGGGSGPSGAPKLEDILGGTNFDEALDKCKQGLAKLDQIKIKQVKDQLAAAVALIATDDGMNGARAAGIAMVESLKPVVSSLKAEAASNPAAADMFKAFNGLAESHNSSFNLKAKAELVMTDLKDSISSKMSLVSGLGGLGLSNGKLGTADFMTNLLDKGSAAGQAAMAAMVEGVNSKLMNDIGMKVDLQMPGNPLDTFKPPQTGTSTIGGGKVPKPPSVDELLAGVPDWVPEDLAGDAAGMLDKAGAMAGTVVSDITKSVTNVTSELTSSVSSTVSTVTKTVTETINSDVANTVTKTTSDVVNKVTTKLVSDPTAIIAGANIPLATASPDAIVNSIKTKIPGIG